MNKISARTLAATATLALAAAAGTAAAQSDYPNKPIKLIAPYAPGGSVDVLARTLATHLSTELRQSVVVENRPGANTMIAASAVARSPADGYTLLLASNASMVLNPLLYKKLSYNPDKELKLTNILAEAPLVLVTNSQTGIKSVADLKAYSKARPGQLNYSSVGLGNPLQLTTELIKSRLDVAATHIPFNGSAPALTALPHIKAGKLVAIATTGPERSQFLPQTPTIAESGVPGFRASTWFGIAVPAGTPAQARNALQAAVNKVLLNPEFASALGSQTLAARKPQTQAQLDEFLAADSQMWRKVIADNGIALEN
jgi:tripartite-type tricarboxylate transporter receptor subunit TctC